MPFLRDVIELDGQHVGWVLGLGSLIGIATGPVILWLEGRTGAGTVIVTGIVVSGLAVLALAVSTTFWEVLMVWIVLSLAQWVSFTTAIGERQRHAPAHLQARVGITGRAIAIASMTAGATGASLLANVVELRTLYVGHGNRNAARRRRARPAASARARPGRPERPVMQIDPLRELI